MTDLRFEYDLHQETDPDFRAGIYGLYLLCKYVRHPKFRHRYPDVPDDVAWDIDEDNDRITIWGPEKSICQLITHGWGHMRDGLAVLPGYTDNPNAPGIYATAVGHQTQTMVFNPAKKATRRRAMSFANKQKYAPEGFNLKETWGTLVKADDSVINIRTNPWLPFKLDGTELKPLDLLALDNIAGSHPQWQQWHFPPGTPPKTPKVQHTAVGQRKMAERQRYMTDALLLHCAQYAHIGVRHHNGITGFVPDVGTFLGFDRAVRRYSHPSDSEAGWLYSVQAGPEVAITMMSRFLDLPTGRTYSYLCTRFDGNSKRLAGQVLYNRDQESLSEKFLGACRVLDVKGNLRRLQRAPLRVLARKDGKVSQFISIYDQVMDNVTCRRPWFHGFGALSGLKPEETEWMGHPLTALSRALGDSMEQQIKAFVSNCVYNRANREWERKGRTKAEKGALKELWWKVLTESREYVAKVYLRQITTSAQLVKALRRMVEETGTKLSIEVLAALQEMRPDEAADLLGLHCFTYAPKNGDVPVPPGDPNDDDTDDTDDEE